MSGRPLAGIELIQPDWRDRYEQRHLFFMNELVNLNHYLFYLEQIAAFPWTLFGDLNNHYWHFTSLAMLETSLQITHRVAFDGGTNLTLPKFSERIKKHLIDEPTLKLYVTTLDDFDFQSKSVKIAKRIKYLRNNRLAHLSGLILSDKNDERPYLESVSVRDLQEVAKYLHDFFQIVSLGVSCALTYPDLMEDRQPSSGPRWDPDIVELLDLIAKNSDLLKMPEQQEAAWPYYKNNLSDADLQTVNKWRAKFNLPAV